MTVNSQIFITGGTGFVGSYLIRHLLASGYTRIRALRRAQSRAALVADFQDRIDWVEGDLFDYDVLCREMQVADVVFHCAAMISFSKRDFRQMLKVNVDGTAHMINAALEGDIKQFLHVSSVAALGRSKDQTTISESNEFEASPLNTGYGLTKHLAEREVWRGMSEGLSATVINPAMILGAGYWDTGTCKLIDTIYRGLRFYPQGQSGYVDVRDVAHMSIKMLEENCYQTNLICCSESLPIRQVIRYISEGLQRPEPAIRLTPILRQLAWRGARILGWINGEKPLITKETLATSAVSYTFDNNRSRTLLDFNYISVKQSVAATCQSYLTSKTTGSSFGLLPSKT